MTWRPTGYTLGLGALLAVTLALAGCTNALLFYDTAKVSLTIEGRPDSTQPIQGSFGGKERTVVVTPPKSGDGESAAMISSFRVKKEPGFFGPVTMRSALVTGDAAKSLSEPQAKAAARAVAALVIPEYDGLAASSIEAARAQQKEAKLAELTALPCDTLTEAQRSELGLLTRVGENYNCSLHATIQTRLAAGGANP